MPIVVGFVSQKGGVGKSTLARALGAVVAHGGLKVRIADLDAKQQTVLAWEEARHENQVAPTVRAQAFKGVTDAIAAADPDELVILDASAGGGRRLQEIAARADLLVQPSSGSLDDLRPTVMLFHNLVQAGVPKERLVVALCRTLSEAEEDAARNYIEKAGYDVLAGSIPERGGYRDAQNRGQALTETNQKTLNDRAMELMNALFKKVMAQLKKRDKAAKAEGVR